MTFPKDPPWTETCEHYQRAISQLEGWAFGRRFRFAAFGSGRGLQMHFCVTDGGWTEVRDFYALPGLREFTEKLDAAIEPICADYARELRKALSDEATILATRALGPGPESN